MAMKKDTRDWILLAISSISLIGLAILDASCTRDTGGTATLTLTLPNNVSMSSDSIHDLSWGQSTPTAFSNVACFFVMVSGPENTMSNSSCNYNSGATVYPVGMVGGSFAPGSTVSLPVPAGQNRTVTIVGTASDGTVACPSFPGLINSQSHFSNPVYLGSAGGVNMADGSTVNLSIPVTNTIGSTQTLSGCSGPAFGNLSGGGGGNGPPVALKIVWQDNLTSLHTSACIPVNVVIVDSTGSNASVTSNYSVTFNAAVGSFYSDVNCSASTTGVSFTSFSTWSGFYGAPATAGTETIGATATGLTTFTSASIPITGGTTSKLGFVDIKTLTTLAAGTTVPAYTCRNLLIQAQDSLGIPTGTAYSAAVGVALSSQGLIYGTTDSLCANTGNSSVGSQTLTKGNYPFYFMGNSTLTNLSTTNTGALSSAAGSSSILSLTTNTYSASPTQLQIVPLNPTGNGNFNGQSTFGLNVGNCQAVEIAFTDAAYNRGVGTSGTLTFHEDGNTPSHFWSSSDCSTTALTTLGTSGTDWHKVVYVKYTSGATSHVLSATISPSVFTGASVTFATP